MIQAAPERVAPYLWAQLGRDLSELRPEVLTGLAPGPEEQAWILRGACTELMMRSIA